MCSFQFFDWFKIVPVPYATTTEMPEAEHLAKVTYSSHSFCRCSLVDTYSCTRQSRKALGRFHRADRENLHKGSGEHK